LATAWAYRFLRVLGAAGLVSAFAAPLWNEATSRPEADEPPAGLTRADWSQIRRSIQHSVPREPDGDAR